MPLLFYIIKLIQGVLVATLVGKEIDSYPRTLFGEAVVVIKFPLQTTGSITALLPIVTLTSMSHSFQYQSFLVVRFRV